MWIYLNHRFVHEQDAVISVFDHGFLYGDGVYETLRSYGPRLFMRDEHLSRLFRSAEAIGLKIPIPLREWPIILQEAMARNGIGTDQQDAYLRITISRGPGDIGLDPALCPSPTVVVMAKPLLSPTPDLYERGVTIIVASTRRNLPSALSPQIKALNFLNNILAKQEAIAAGAFDSILLNWEQHLTECTISNLFFVTNGALRTPSLDCGLLDGITRAVVIRLAQKLHIPVEEGHFTVDQLYQADECFLTNTSMEILPVTTIDTRTIAGGKPGSVTLKLRSQFIEARGWFGQATG
ncbi:MAG: branched-chain amino acid aminotransferase [Nitrospira sp. WS238]|nr:branched-chain amino acid aminotransferase [Nitrospira sp. WS238]